LIKRSFDAIVGKQQVVNFNGSTGLGGGSPHSNFPAFTQEELFAFLFGK
jgi:hypothetical protein